MSSMNKSSSSSTGVMMKAEQKAPISEAERLILETKPVNGYLADPTWQLPRKVVHCNKPQRERDGALAAHEYDEEEATFQAKIRLLAQICMKNKDILAYTGAGISTAAGIYDYASESAGKKSQVAKLVKEEIKVEDLRPTHAHMILSRMYQADMLHHWIQQNHDCLPQKAGFPQHAMNEIHGSWSDPSNRVINFSEHFREDLEYDCFEVWYKKAQVCLTLGTSLSNMSADMVVDACGQRAKLRFQSYLKKNKRCLENWEGNIEHLAALGGTVIVGFQCTRLDDIAALRIYSSIEKVFEALAQEFLRLLNPSSPQHALFAAPYVDDLDLWVDQLTPGKSYPNGRIIQPDVYELWGYREETGELIVDRAAKNSNKQESVVNTSNKRKKTCIELDLRVGRRIKLVCGKYDKGCIGEVIGKNDVGNYLIRVYCMRRYRLPNGRSERRMGYADRIFGLWHIVAALEGKLLQFPLFNEVL